MTNTMTIKQLTGKLTEYAMEQINGGEFDTTNITHECRQLAKNTYMDEFYELAKHDQDEFERIIDEAIDEVEEKASEYIEELEEEAEEE